LKAGEDSPETVSDGFPELLQLGTELMEGIIRGCFAKKTLIIILILRRKR